MSRERRQMTAASSSFCPTAFLRLPLFPFPCHHQASSGRRSRTRSPRLPIPTNHRLRPARAGPGCLGRQRRAQATRPIRRSQAARSTSWPLTRTAPRAYCRRVPPAPSRSTTSPRPCTERHTEHLRSFNDPEQFRLALGSRARPPSSIALIPSSLLGGGSRGRGHREFGVAALPQRAWR